LDNAWFEMVCQSALGHRSSQEQTYDLARLVLQRGIPGDFVECGVYAGASSAIMARAIMDDDAWEAPGYRRVHLFDSFMGIPKPGPHDTELAANRGGEAACSLDGVKANMKAWDIPAGLLVYHPGLFRDTVPYKDGTWLAHRGELSPKWGAIALLRLDGDLYESTKICMEHLYPMVSPGGYVIVDDFNLSGCRKAVLEEPIGLEMAPVVWRKPK
jgi:O-methyltransferase